MGAFPPFQEENAPFYLRFWFQTRWDTTPITADDVSVQGEARRSQRSLDADGALGLVLHFLNSSMAQFTLNEIFGIVPGFEYKYSGGQDSVALQTFSMLIRKQHPMLQRAFGFVDGLHLPVEAAGDAEMQNAYYNGWVHAHFTSNVFVFAPLGTINLCMMQ
ncbi:uncharacterized protein V1513DRAFT_427908 [Lipomyces chichibuensis]|uniref:uncharacterized protein n=1 Tax=Lipomyces chichibuensis TaxID=1546026 RepID=UPI0033430AB0